MPPRQPLGSARRTAWTLGFPALLAIACGTDDPAAASECELEPGAAIYSSSFTTEIAHVYMPDHLVADADYVYFADGRAIHRVPRCGGPAEELIAGARPFNDGLALADGTLYWIEGDDGTLGPRIRAAPVGGGEPLTLSEFEGYPHRLRVDAETVVWNASVSGFPDQARLHAVDRSGGETRTLAQHRYGWSFDLDAGVVYAAGYLPDSDPATSDRLMFALPVAGGEPSVLVDDFADTYPSDPEVGGEHVYYVRKWASDTLAIERVGKTGGVASALDFAGDVASETLIYAGDQLYGVEIGGDVVRLVAGETPMLLVPRDSLGVTSRVFGDAAGLVVADSFVTCVEWWSDPSGEPPGETCVRESIDVRVLWLGR